MSRGARRARRPARPDDAGRPTLRRTGSPVRSCGWASRRSAEDLVEECRQEFFEILRELIRDEIVVARVSLTAHHRPSPRTQTLYEQKGLPAPAELRVVTWVDDSSYGLVAHDEKGEPIFATHHDSFEQACLRAETAFRVRAAEWVKCRDESE